MDSKESYTQNTDEFGILSIDCLAGYARNLRRGKGMPIVLVSGSSRLAHV